MKAAAPKAKRLHKTAPYIASLRAAKTEAQAYAGLLGGMAPVLLTDEHGVRMQLWRWQASALAPALGRILAGETRRLLVLAPPGHGKSPVTSILLPAVALGLDPNRKILLASSAHDTATAFSRACREVVEAPAYRRAFPETKPDKERGWTDRAWFVERTTKGEKDPSVAAVGLGGQIMMKRANLLICDDVQTPKTSATTEERRKTLRSLRTLFARRTADGSIVVVGQRLHEDDVYASLLKDWTGPRDEIVRLPALAEPGDPIGREAGDPLCPEKWDRAALDDLRADLGPQLFECLCQMNPEALKGEYFQHDWILMDADEAPDLKKMSIVLSFDLAISDKERADYFVGGACGFDGEGNLWLLEKRRGKGWDFKKQYETVVDMARKYQRAKIAIESVAYQKALAQAVRAWAPVLAPRIVEVSRYLDKATHARPLQALAARGGLHIGPGDLDAQGEMLAFTGDGDEHDDIVDMMANAMEVAGKVGRRKIKIRTTPPEDRTRDAVLGALSALRRAGAPRRAQDGKEQRRPSERAEGETLLRRKIIFRRAGRREEEGDEPAEGRKDKNDAKA